MTRNIDINEDLLLWKPLDMGKLQEYLNVCSILKTNPKDIVEYVENAELLKSNINSWFEATISILFNKLLEGTINRYNLTYKEKTVIEDLRNNFEPYIKGMDSLFGNILDDIKIFNEKPETIFQNVREVIQRESEKN